MLFELSRLRRYTIPLLLILSALSIAQETASSRSPNQDSSRMASVAQWNALIPKIKAELARNKDTCEHSAKWPILVVDAVDLSGVGEPVALLDWCNGGAYTDSLILMRLESGRPVMARFRLRDGNYGDVEFLSGSSVHHSCSAELHPEKHAVYNIELEMDGSSENSVAEVVRARVDVYVWNRKTKTLDWDRALSKQESRARTGKKPSKSRLINVFVSRPNIVVHGAFLSEVQLWEIPTGTGITEAEHTLLGKGKRVTPAGTTEKWFFPIPPCSTERILATSIYASGFDDHGRNIGSKSLPYSGATAIDEALCGARQRLSAKQKAYRSPDGSLNAVVRSVSQPEATDESEVLVQTASGKILGRRNYRSEDGEHGFGVTKAQWTPDSQFFVYSLDSSGGHQAWHSPVQYFSRRSDSFVSLDDALNDAVMNPQFSVEAPDKVTVELYFGKKTSTVSLSSLKNKRRAGR